MWFRNYIRAGKLCLPKGNGTLKNIYGLAFLGIREGVGILRIKCAYLKKTIQPNDPDEIIQKLSAHHLRASYSQQIFTELLPCARNSPRKSGIKMSWVPFRFQGPRNLQNRQARGWAGSMVTWNREP